MYIDIVMDYVQKGRIPCLWSKIANINSSILKIVLWSIIIRFVFPILCTRKSKYKVQLAIQTSISNVEPQSLQKSDMISENNKHYAPLLSITTDRKGTAPMAKHKNSTNRKNNKIKQYI